MQVVYKAYDGTIFNVEEYCLEYETICGEAEIAVEHVKFRDYEKQPVYEEPIIYHNPETVQKAWRDFLGVIIKLIKWSEMYKEWTGMSGDEEPEDIEDKMIAWIQGYSDNLENKMLISFENMNFYLFNSILHKFKAVNLKTGKEYVHGTYRPEMTDEEYLEQIKKDYCND